MQKFFLLFYWDAKEKKNYKCTNVMVRNSCSTNVELENCLPATYYAFIFGLNKLSLEKCSLAPTHRLS